MAGGAGWAGRGFERGAATLFGEIWIDLVLPQNLNYLEINLEKFPPEPSGPWSLVARLIRGERCPFEIGPWSVVARLTRGERRPFETSRHRQFTHRAACWRLADSLLAARGQPTGDRTSRN
eukprot:3905991-Prymnesium_polylepis.1